MWDDSHLFRWRQISISGGSQSTIWYSLRQDCRDAQKKYVMLCMTRISQQECRGILEFCKRNSQFIYNNDKKITIYQSKRTQRERKIQKKYSIQRFLRKIKFIQKSLTYIYCCDIIISVAHKKPIFLRKMKRILKES